MHVVQNAMAVERHANRPDVFAMMQPKVEGDGG